MESQTLKQLVQAIASSATLSDFDGKSSLTVPSITNLSLNDADSVEHLGPVIQYITDTHREEAFLDQLDLFLRKTDAEIERMCNSNYQEFVHSVDQLLKVRHGTIALKDKIVNLNIEMQRSGKRLTEKKQQLIESRRVQSNIDQAIDTLNTSLIVLELANRVNVEMGDKRYYAALKTLDELQNQQLRHVMQYTFANYLEEGIIAMQNKIKDEVTKDLKEWLLSVRVTSRHIGKMAMAHMQERQERWQRRTAKFENLKSVQHHAVNSPIEVVVNDADGSNILDEINIDFSYLYRCLHIYDYLGKRDEFKFSYEEDRRAQANLALAAPLNLCDGNTNDFDSMLQEIVGFFIVEHIITHSTIDFRSQHEVDTLWDMVTAKVITVISEGLRSCRDPELFLMIKHRLQVFIQTLEGFDYNVKHLQETLLTLFQRYSELLTAQYSEVLEKIVEEDECMPMTVEHEEELKEVINLTHFQEDPAAAQQGFPRTLPFSKVYPTCCRDVEDFIGQFYRFTTGFAQLHGEMDDILKKAVDSLLIKRVNAILLKKLTSTNLSQIVQIIINIEFFKNACKDFEALLMETRSFHRAGHINLKAASVFKETQAKAEKRIFELVNLKIDEFIELADYDWQTSRANNSPSPYLQDLVTYLSTVIIAALMNLPVSVKAFIYFDALDHLANAMKAVLLSPNVRKISEAALQNYDVDISYLEDFVEGLHDPNLLDMFLELRQMLTLLKSENPDEFLNQSLRNRKYSKLSPGEVATVLEKVLGDNNVTNVLNPKEKVRRRKMEDVVRIQKELVHMLR